MIRVRRRSPRLHPDRDLDSLAERFGALLVVRLAMAVTVLVVATAVPKAARIGVQVVAPVTGAYVAFAVIAEWARRMLKLRIVDIPNIMLLVDVVYIALILAPTGGPQSELVFLFYVHLIAVTLLGTHRTGLRIALLDSLMFVFLFTFSLNEEINRVLGSPVPARASPSSVVLAILAFWLIAACTAFFSWVNERELRRSKQELEALSAMGAALERAAGPEQMMRVLLAKSTDAFRFSRGAVLLDLPAGTTAVTTESEEPLVIPDARPDVVVERAWAERGPVLVRALDPVFDSCLDRLLPAARNVVVLPLTAEGEPLGALAVERGGPLGAKLPLRAVTMLAQFAANAALEVRNARLMAEIERLAKQDGLTGLANRRVFEEVLAREMTRSRRTYEPLSLVVLDVDHFKRVNDTLGHQAGDDVLRQVAQVLAGAARDVDLVARYGGEEFTVILPNCSLEDAIGVAERMRTGLSGDVRTAKITLSAGVATFPPNAADEEGLIAAADEALYESKRSGRNRTTASNRRGPAAPVVRR